MSDYKFTDYFEKEVLRKRPYIKKEWCISVLENPIKMERQEHNRFRYWGAQLMNLKDAFCALSRWMINGQFITRFQTGGLSHET